MRVSTPCTWDSTPGGPAQVEPADAGRPAAGSQGSLVAIRLVCDTCHEDLLVAFPRGSARYGAVDCPECGSGYVFRLEPHRAGVAQNREA
jgi:hypothetical protein